MTWTDSLLTASWRGVEFEVDTSSGRFGRRTARHEYPQRDTPAVEDLGRATRELRLDGFVIGDDYAARRDALIAACERPGSGVLIHPYLGRLNVTGEVLEVSETVQDGRMATLRFLFVESGELQFPTGLADPQAGLEAAAEQVSTTVLEDFVAAFNLTGSAELLTRAVDVASSRLSDMETAISAPGKAISDTYSVLSRINSLQEQASTLLLTPSVYATDVLALFGEVADFASLWEYVQAVPAVQAPTDDSQEAVNREALNRLYFRAALANMALGISADLFGSYDDAVALRAAIVAEVQAEEVDDAVQSRQGFEALVTLRGAISGLIGELATNLPRLETVNVLESEPAVVLAHELYADPLRDSEIISRNGVWSPLFVSGALRVLSA